MKTKTPRGTTKWTWTDEDKDTEKDNKMDTDEDKGTKRDNKMDMGR